MLGRPQARHAGTARPGGAGREIARHLGFASLDAFRKHVRANGKLYATSRGDILERYQKYVDQTSDKLPELFGHLPKGKMTIKPVESFREAQAAGANDNAGTPDGARPGAVMVNTYQPTKRLTIDMESTAYHEGVPRSSATRSDSSRSRACPGARARRRRRTDHHDEVTTDRNFLIRFVNSIQPPVVASFVGPGLPLRSRGYPNRRALRSGRAPRPLACSRGRRVCYTTR